MRLAAFLAFLFFLALGGSVPGVPERGQEGTLEQRGLQGRIGKLCVSSCQKLYKDDSICSTELGKFCHWVHHLRSDLHLVSIQQELNKVAEIEKENAEDALAWAVEDLIAERHKTKEASDHQMCEDLENSVIEVVTGMLAFYARDEL